MTESFSLPMKTVTFVYSNFYYNDKRYIHPIRLEIYKEDTNLDVYDKLLKVVSKYKYVSKFTFTMYTNLGFSRSESKFIPHNKNNFLESIIEHKSHIHYIPDDEYN